MDIWRAPGTAARLALAVAFLLAACTTETPGGDGPSPADSEPTAPAAIASPSPSEEPAAEALSAYEDYVNALAAALAAGDPEASELAEHATGSALETARQQLLANATDGLIATGTIQPAAAAAEVTVEGDRATIQDCLLNDLAQVRSDAAAEVVQPATGNRQPLRAVLARGENGWIVSELSGPELRGPLQGGESCAPPAVEQELLGRYEAFWDAVYTAGDPGGGQPADPDSPALGETMLDPQLSDTRAAFGELRAAGQVLRGRIETAPIVLGLFEYDQSAVVLDCVITPSGSGIYDVATNQPVGDDDSDARTLDNTQMRIEGATWKVVNWDIGEVQECTRPDE